MISFALAMLLFGQSATNGSGIDYETARFERKLQTIKISERITIDGRIDEPAWAKAAVSIAITGIMSPLSDFFIVYNERRHFIDRRPR